MASEGSDIVERPIFTVDKVNTQGWRLDASEAKRFADTLVGKPVRYCKCGTDFGDGTPKEHSCDVAKDAASIVGNVGSVYPKTNSRGETVYYAKVQLKDGVKRDALPDGWSVYGKANGGVDEKGYAHDTGADALAFTFKPAWSEARDVYASESNLNINTTGANKVNNMINEGQQTNNTTPNVTQVTLAGTPAETPAPVKEPEKTFSKAEMEKMLEARDKELVEKAKREIQRDEMATELAAKMAKAGVIKDTDLISKRGELQKLDLTALEVLKSSFDAMTTVKPPVQPGVASAPIQSNVGAPRELQEGERFWMEKFGIDEKTWRKYNS